MAMRPVSGSCSVAQGKQTLGTKPFSSYHSSGVSRKFSQRYFTLLGSSMSRIAAPKEYTKPEQVLDAPW